MKDNIKFDMEAAIKALREGKDLSGQGGRGCSKLCVSCKLSQSDMLFQSTFKLHRHSSHMPKLGRPVTSLVLYQSLVKQTSQTSAPPWGGCTFSAPTCS